MAVDTLCHLLALLVTPANEQERTQVGKLAQGGKHHAPNSWKGNTYTLHRLERAWRAYRGICQWLPGTHSCQHFLVKVVSGVIFAVGWGR